MSKAEDRAKELYPDWEVTGVPKIDGQEESMVRIQRVAYITGYHQAEEDLSDKAKVSSGLDGFYYGQGYKQAEKDLELTWEDLAIIKQLSDDFVKHNQTPMSDEEFYKEIVKRFKERKVK